MASGCRKADRHRKSAQNAAYKSGNRRKVNSDKKVARHKKQCVGKVLAVPRGTARSKRRLGKQQAYAARQAA